MEKDGLVVEVLIQFDSGFVLLWSHLPSLCHRHLYFPLGVVDEGLRLVDDVLGISRECRGNWKERGLRLRRICDEGDLRGSLNLALDEGACLMQRQRDGEVEEVMKGVWKEVGDVSERGREGEDEWKWRDLEGKERRLQGRRESA